MSLTLGQVTAGLLLMAQMTNGRKLDDVTGAMARTWLAQLEAERVEPDEFMSRCKGVATERGWFPSFAEFMAPLRAAWARERSFHDAKAYADWLSGRQALPGGTPSLEAREATKARLDSLPDVPMHRPPRPVRAMAEPTPEELAEAKARRRRMVESLREGAE